MKKEVCKHCVETSPCHPWTPLDDKHWVHGRVFCVVEGHIENDGEIPIACAFRLEHMVLENNEKVNL